MQPRAERRATYARWWGVVKKEAKHYWVRRRGGSGWFRHSSSVCGVWRAARCELWTTRSAAAM